MNEMRFDYIIIGGGSAGCVLANRLSEQPENTVCLLEAGPSDDNYWIRNCNPLNMLYLMNSKKYNWRYQTDPEASTGNRPFFWPRGKALGGSSSINAMIYTRGHPWDYDHWASLGNRGWDYQSVLPWFIKSERQQRGADAFHGDQGSMHVLDTNYHFPVSEAFLEACNQAGITLNNDMNGEQQEGCGYFQVTQTPDGRRCNAALAFLDEAMHRPNLQVFTESQATRILFEHQRASGVEYTDTKNGRQRIKLTANKTVILSAGVINSPQLLKLSGIGPGAELQQHGIPVVRDLPGVGENLQDHPDVILRYRDKSKTSFATTPGPHLLPFLRHYFSRKTPLIYTPTDSGGFIKSDTDQAIPDLQLQFAALRMQAHGRRFMTSSQFGYVLHICHLRPSSRGQVLLRSADPMASARIRANYFANEKELDALVNGVKLSRQILAKPAMQPFSGLEEQPGSDVQNDDDIRTFIKQHVETVYHTAGSCKMGDDDMAVVDANLKVHGIEALHIIDASIMPTITGSNIHGPTVMIAERGAHILLTGSGAA